MHLPVRVHALACAFGHVCVCVRACVRACVCACVRVCVPVSDVTPVDYEGAKALTLGEWGMLACDR